MSCESFVENAKPLILTAIARSTTLEDVSSVFVCEKPFIKPNTNRNDNKMSFGDILDTYKQIFTIVYKG